MDHPLPWLGLLCLLLLTACEPERDGAGDEALLRSWTRSHEEEPASSSDRIYRPSGSRTFPPSRFREEIVFHRNGTLDYLFLSPVDAHAMKQGRWEIAGTDPVVLTLHQENGKERFHLVSVRPDELRLRALP